MWKSETTCEWLVPFFHHVGPRDWTKTIRIGSNQPYPPLTGFQRTLSKAIFVHRGKRWQGGYFHWHLSWIQLPSPSQNHVMKVSICSSISDTAALLWHWDQDRDLSDPIGFACEVTWLQVMWAMPSFIQHCSTGTSQCNESWQKGYGLCIQAAKWAWRNTLSGLHSSGQR